MKLVIDIPEEDYIRLRDEGMFGNVTTFKRAVREGIPLAECEPCTVPSVNPAEKMGRWVYNKNLSTHYGDVYTCSECGERCLESCYDHIDKLPNFCPKCHIKMEVKE